MQTRSRQGKERRLLADGKAKGQETMGNVTRSVCVIIINIRLLMAFGQNSSLQG